MAHHEIASQIEPDLFIGESGSRPDPAEGDQFPRPVADFLLQLASRAHLWRLARVQLPCRHLQQPAASRVSVLPDQQHMAIRGQRNHGGRPRMPDHLQLSDAAIGQLHLLHREVNDFALVDLLSLEYLAVAHARMLQDPGIPDLEEERSIGLGKVDILQP